MKDDDLLQLNPRKIIRCLRPLVSDATIDVIEVELRRNVTQLIRLGQAHLRFAKRAEGQNMWRQRVSRAYYCAYSVSRAVRLEATGAYSADVGDHKKIDNLPEDFEDLPRWKDLLTKFRGDRNLADYDHSINEAALEMRSAEYVQAAEEFLIAAKDYLKNRGAL